MNLKHAVTKFLNTSVMFPSKKKEGGERGRVDLLVTMRYIKTMQLEKKSQTIMLFNKVKSYYRTKNVST